MNIFNLYFSPNSLNKMRITTKTMYYSKINVIKGTINPMPITSIREDANDIKKIINKIFFCFDVNIFKNESKL